MTSEQTTDPKRGAPMPLWRAMRAFLCLLFDLFGEPSDIASAWLGRRNRALLMPWLRAGEAFLRRLIFIEALALAEGQRARKAPKIKRAARTRKRCEFFADKPEDWRVSFRLFPTRHAAPGSGGRRRLRAAPLDLPRALVAPRPETARFMHARAPARTAPQLAPRDTDDAWPITERMEAMLRVYNAPHASALRLARMLRRNEQRARRVLRPAPAHSVGLFGAERFNRCNAIVASRLRRRDRALPPNDSS